MGSDATRLYLGGDYTKAGGVAQQHFAMWIDTASTSVPGAPVLSGTAGNGVVYLSWQPPSSDGGSTILRYKIWRKLAGATKYPNAALATVSSGTTYADSTVTNGTAYSYQVVAVNGVGNGPSSNELTVTPGATAPSAPSAPSGLTATLSSSSVTLGWTAPTSPGNPALTRYDVYRGTTSGQRSFLTSVPAGTTTFSDALPPTGTTYFYTVRAVNTVGSGPDSNEVSAGSSSTGAPTQPTLSATAGTASINLSWTAGSGGGAADKWIILRDNVQLARVTDPNARTYSDTTVVAGTTYTYKVRAVNSVGSSPNSNPVTVTAP
jgi:titin